jgi:hypothetical protein
VKHLVLTVCAVVALLVTLQVMLEYRNVGLSVLVGEGEIASGRFEKRQLLEEQHLRVDDNFYRLCQIIQLIPASYGFVYHKYFIYVIVRPVPEDRELIRIKFADIQINPTVRTDHRRYQERCNGCRRRRKIPD